MISPSTLPILIVTALCVAGCAGGVPPNVVQGGIATVETAICIINTESTDNAAGMSAGAIVSDIILKCGSDAATIARVLDAQHAAMARQKATLCK